MPRSMNEGFSTFLSKLTPTSTETAAAKSHRASIEACLKANFGLTRFFRTGSFGNGTSISGYSDVDYFAVIPTEKLKADSRVTLTSVKNILANRFPNTGVRVTTPTVLVPFGIAKSESTEVAPCDYVKYKNGFNVYDIADGSGEWFNSSPDAHNYYVREIDKKHNGKVKNLIRLIKAWKYYQNVPISSFYIELRVAEFCKDESTILYEYDIKTIFSRLLGNNLAKLQDPMGISGLIAPCETDAKLIESISKLSTALSRSEKALASVQKENIKDAFEWYNLLYNGNFTSYYY